jgi:protein TonB
MATLFRSGVPSGRQRFWFAAAIALLAESALLGGGYVLLVHKAPAPPVEPPVTMVSLAPVPAPQPVPSPAPQPPQPPQPQPARPAHPVTPTHRVAHAAPPPPRPAPVPVPDAAPPSTASTTPTEPQPAPRPPPPAAPVPAAAPAAANASFEGALRAAIQAALHYPESARMAGMTGRTRVAFQYRDGAVSGERVVISSGVGLLDRAALAAVRDAAYPRPEPAFAGKTLSEQLWVTFTLNDHE